MKTAYSMNADGKIQAIGRVEIAGEWLYVFSYRCNVARKTEYAEVTSAPCGQGMYPVYMTQITDTLTDAEFKRYNEL